MSLKAAARRAEEGQLSRRQARVDQALIKHPLPPAQADEPLVQVLPRPRQRAPSRPLCSKVTSIFETPPVEVMITTSPSAAAAPAPRCALIVAVCIGPGRRPPPAGWSPCERVSVVARIASSTSRGSATSSRRRAAGDLSPEASMRGGRPHSDGPHPSGHGPQRRADEPAGRAPRAGPARF